MRVPAALAPIVLLALALPAGAAPPAANRFNLKPDAGGKVCLGCHADFEEKLRLPAVHTPVKQGACVGCHDPHASEHGKLLSADASRICLTCHEGIVPEGAKSLHAAVLDGGCVSCHDPHASANRGNLLEAGNALCLTCHADLGESVAARAFKHPPVGQSCLGCHDPHASTKAESLLVADQSALCTKCHRTDQAGFVKAHGGYPVARGRCASCHDPHGSSSSAMLWPTVHPPVASRSCERCHNDPGSPDALAPSKRGVDGCRGCHGEVIGEMLAARRPHWPVVEGEACLNCHGPHATKEPALLAAAPKRLCARCHADTLARQERGASQHEPSEQGQCAACHAPHAADRGFLLVGGVLETCGACHEWSTHSTHPIGEKVVDPRNPNLTLDCRSCHGLHGTPFKYLASFDHRADLCVQCHTEFKR